MVFTADEFGDGLPAIIKSLARQKIEGSFFFTGNFYRTTSFQPYIKQLQKNGHYLGPHSDKHLLYCDWNKRDSLLITQEQFSIDLNNNIKAMRQLKINIPARRYFIPPYEWWNDTIASWAKQMGWQLINFTPGIRTNADYTYPEMGATYKSNDDIFHFIQQYSQQNPSAFNGAILLVHAGTDKRRKDKFYNRLDELIEYFKQQGYRFKRIDTLLQ